VRKSIIKSKSERLEMIRNIIKRIGNLIDQLFFCDAEELYDPAPIVRKQTTQLRPIRISGSCIDINTETMRRLTHIRNRASMMRDELDAMADECCLLLDIDPRSQGVAADFARDIVDRGISVGHAIDQVARHRKRINT
jgi:hypothetical protein